jgi:hypothetical protein
MRSVLLGYNPKPIDGTLSRSSLDNSTRRDKGKGEMINNAEDTFQGVLRPGERIVWSGKPQQGFMIRTSDIWNIPFGVLWAGYVLFLVLTAVQDVLRFPDHLQSQWPGAGILILFALMGFYLLFGRFIVDILQRQRTDYLLAEERVIILTGWFSRNVKSIDLRDIPEINLSRKHAGRGTITFGSMDDAPRMYIGFFNFGNGRSRNLLPAFEMIDDVETVYQQILIQQREIKNRRSHQIMTPIEDDGFSKSANSDY